MENGQFATRYSQLASAQFASTPLAIRYSLLAVQAILNLKICDPACGSGHFLIAAARRLARRLAQLRTGEGEPAPKAMRAALREVISQCIYGVDINPMSVELCKVSLWMEALEPGKPLSFLDAHIQCGDSLVGVSPNLDISEIPDEAFNPAFGDDKATASALKKRNKRERGGSHPDKAGQLGFRFEVTHMTSMDDLARWLAEHAAQVDAMPEDDSTQVQAKAKAFDDYHTTREYLTERLELDLWTAAFFWKIPKADGETMLAPTQQELIQLRNGGELDSRLVEGVKELSERLNFFHWELAFPKVFSGDNLGFDCVLGNPPWDRLKPEPTKFFASSIPDIANAATSAIRQKLLEKLESQDPVLFDKWKKHERNVLLTDIFLTDSGRYKLTAQGKFNLGNLFLELGRAIISETGKLGMLNVSGLATDDSGRMFIADVMNTGSLVSFYDFENNDFFQHVDSRYKFSAITLTGKKNPANSADFVFFGQSVSDLTLPDRHISYTADDIRLLNPLSGNCPVFRTKQEASLVKKMYKAANLLPPPAEVLFRWKTEPTFMFVMSDHSGLFLKTNEFQNDETYLPLYESKMFHQFDHRWSHIDENETQVELNSKEKADNLQFVTPRYWMRQADTNKKLDAIPNQWQIAIRSVTNPTNERTIISTVLPKYPVGHSAQVFRFYENALLACVFVGCLNSVVFDFAVRTKIGGSNLSSFILRQLPVLPADFFNSSSSKDEELHSEYIGKRVFELIYTAWDLEPFAQDVLNEIGIHKWNTWYPNNQIDKLDSRPSPFRWDDPPGRRAQLRAELDATYARLYGLTRDELRYILDPKEVHGEDFPGETFRVLKEKEIRLYGEYRTRRLVLEAWDGMESGIERVEEIVQSLDPALALPAEVAIAQSLPEITWIPVNLSPNQVHLEHPTPIQRQSYAFAWLLVNFGTGKSIPSFDAQKYSYFLQRTGIADLEIPYKEFARGPYSPELTYRAGTYAKKQGFWEVLGKNIARRRNIGKAVNAAEEIFTNVQQARGIVEQLEKISKNDLGGLATVDSAARKVFEKSQAITPENIRAYFMSDWSEKVNDPWYTDENINRAIELLSELGLFQGK